jgi:glucan 1,3-beta-glucosidase
VPESPFSQKQAGRTSFLFSYGFCPPSQFSFFSYFLKAIQWARKYGLRINLDLHALPGSQNGWNHSGRYGSVNVLLGPMGIANAQRALDYIRILAEFISQPQYTNVVTMFGITNEPLGSSIGQDALTR